jgi:hypothetical protein
MELHTLSCYYFLHHRRQQLGMIMLLVLIALVGFRQRGAVVHTSNVRVKDVAEELLVTSATEGLDLQLDKAGG